MERILLTFSIILLLSPITVSSSGLIDNSNSDDTTELVGRIKIKGNEPHTKVVLETEENVDYILVGSQADILKNEYQGHLVSILAMDVSPSQGKKPAEVEVISFEVIE